MYCENCGAQIDTADGVCPNCGHKNPQSSSPVAQPQDPYMQPTAQSQDPYVQTPAQPQDPYMQQTAQPQDPYTQSYTQNYTQSYMQTPEAPTPKKARKIWLWILIPFLVLAVTLAGVYVCAAPYVNNFFARTFMKPDQYYRKVEGKNIDAFSETFSKYYSEQMLPRMRMHDRYYDTEVEVSLEEGGKDLLKLASPEDVDLSWLKSVKLSATSNARDDINSVVLGAYLNGTGLLTFDAIGDVKNECFYLGIPELSDAYMRVDKTSEIFDSMNKRRSGDSVENPFSTLGSGMDSEAMENLYSVLPTEEEVDELTKKYCRLALEEIKDVSKEGSTEVKVGDITQKGTKLVITVDEDTLKTILRKLLEEAKSDEELRLIIMDVAEALGQDEYDVYDEFKDEIDEALDGISDIELEDPIEITVYVDAKGNIFAREFESDEAYSVCKVLKMRSQAAYYIYSETDSESVEIELTGEMTGKAFEGDYEVSCDDSTILIGTVNCQDLEAMKKGEYNVEFSAALSSGATKQLGEYSMFLKKWNVQGTLEGSANDYAADLTLYDGDEKLVTVKAATTIEEGHEKSVPTGNVIEIEKEDDYKEWVETVKWDGLFESLEKADLPKELIDTLKMYTNYVDVYY